MRGTTHSLRATLRTQAAPMMIRVRLTLSSHVSLLILWYCRRLWRLILIVSLLLLLLLFLLYHCCSVRPSLILRLKFPTQPRSLKSFPVRDWIMRRSIHVFTHCDPARAKLLTISEQVQTSQPLDEAFRDGIYLIWFLI